jgi:AcrR family transcriptional regulator
VRAQPQQARSQETVDRILLAADHEVGERGVTGASTTRIAARAGLSVGALYRFFPDKAAVADALAARYLEAVTPAYADAVADVTSVADLDQVLAVLMRRAADLQVQHPGYYRLTEELAPERGDSPAHAVREHLVDLFSSTLGRAGAATPEVELRAVVALCIETVRHTLARHPAGHPDRESAIAETQRMLRAYLTERMSG